MKKIKIRDIEYEIVNDNDECFSLEEVTDKVTDYFDEYDYIFGDYSYDKLRLKGFNDKDNKNFNNINDVRGLEKYIEEFCAFGAKYFLIKKSK